MKATRSAADWTACRCEVSDLPKRGDEYLDGDWGRLGFFVEQQFPVGDDFPGAFADRVCVFPIRVDQLSDSRLLQQNGSPFLQSLSPDMCAK